LEEESDGDFRHTGIIEQIIYRIGHARERREGAARSGACEVTTANNCGQIRTALTNY